MWYGGEHVQTSYRFVIQDASTPYSLMALLFDSVTNIRNYFTKRVIMTVKKFVYNPPKGFGLEKYSTQERLNSLQELVNKGIDRCSSDVFLPLSIFHAFSTRSEMTLNKPIGSQKCLLSTQRIKSAKEEFSELNGGIIEDVLWDSEELRRASYAHKPYTCLQEIQSDVHLKDASDPISRGKD